MAGAPALEPGEEPFDPTPEQSARAAREREALATRQRRAERADRAATITSMRRGQARDKARIEAEMRAEGIDPKTGEPAGGSPGRSPGRSGRAAPRSRKGLDRPLGRRSTRGSPMRPKLANPVGGRSPRELGGSAAGFILGMVVYALLLSAVEYGAQGPILWLRAKYLNEPAPAPGSSSSSATTTASSTTPSAAMLAAAHPAPALAPTAVLA